MKITNKLNLPQPFVDMVTKEYTYKDKQYSVTSLLKGTCQAILERRHADEIEQDVADMIWLIFGTAVHSILEQGQETDDQLKENKIVIDIGDYKLSGIFDLYDAKEKKVTDYKTGSVWKVVYNDWEDYFYQLLMYAYMLRSIGFECNKGEIVMLLKDHSKTKAMTDASYPQDSVYIVSFEFSDSDFNMIDMFILKKFDEIKHQEQLSDDQLMPCNKKERWHKDDVYAVMKKGRKSAVKLYTDELKAVDHATREGDDYYVEYREGNDERCEKYCTVKDFCPFYRLKHEDHSKS